MSGTRERAQRIAGLLADEQARLVSAFEEYDGAGRFVTAAWSRPHLGSGQALVLDEGGVFERASINVSLVHGTRLPASASAHLPETRGGSYEATGLSLLVHPRNPYAPSFHANFRFFGIDDEVWWFGGVCDMSPCYGFDEDAVHFHRTLREWCGRHELGRYDEWKRTCDEYFTVVHRHEMRGIGGIFFDRLAAPGDEGFEHCLSLIRDGLEMLLPAYLPVLDRRSAMPYGERERTWQAARRGRYVEFNLLYDRGTRFGLETGVHPDAMLMALPPVARWSCHSPEPGSAEAELSRFLQPRAWADGSAGSEL